MRREESRLIERLERQRHCVGRVRAYVHDPFGRFTQVLTEYVSWHQERLSRRDALVITPRRIPKGHPLRRALPRMRLYTAKGYTQRSGGIFCIGQVLLFGADNYCPSVAMWRNYLDKVLQLTLPLMSGKDSVFIVVGNANHAGTRFALAYREWSERSGEAAFFQTLDPPELPKAEQKRRKIIRIELGKLRAFRRHRELGELREAPGLRAPVRARAA